MHYYSGLVLILVFWCYRWHEQHYVTVKILTAHVTQVQQQLSDKLGLLHLVHNFAEQSQNPGWAHITTRQFQGIKYTWSSSLPGTPSNGHISKSQEYRPSNSFFFFFWSYYLLQLASNEVAPSQSLCGGWRQNGQLLRKKSSTEEISKPTPVVAGSVGLSLPVGTWIREVPQADAQVECLPFLSVHSNTYPLKPQVCLSSCLGGCACF